MARELLKVERSGKEGHSIQPAHLSRWQKKRPARKTKRLVGVEKYLQADPAFDRMIRGRTVAPYDMQTAEGYSKGDEFLDEEETDKALQWLKTHWETMVTTLRELEPNKSWADGY